MLSSRAASDHDVMFMGSFAGIKHEAVGELDPPTSGGKKAKSSGVATRSFHQSP